MIVYQLVYSNSIFIGRLIWAILDVAQWALLFGRDFVETSMAMPDAKIPVKIWVMLGLVIFFALLLSYFLVIGVYDIAATGH
jgi:hypothetical protein